MCITAKSNPQKFDIDDSKLAESCSKKLVFTIKTSLDKQLPNK